MTSQITFIGIGNMGAALAKAHLNAGTSITIWNRTASRPSVTDLVAAGAKLEQSIADAISASPITIICVLDYTTVYKLLEPLSAADGKGLLSGRTIINLTNGTPRDGRKMGEWIGAQKVHAYLDGGIMAAPYMIGTAESFIFYSGADEATLEKLKGTLEVFGRADYFGSDAGRASLFDLSLLAGLYGMVMGMFVSASLLRTGGEKLEPSVTNLLNPLLTSFQPSLGLFAKAIEDGDDGAYGHPMEMQAVAMQNIGRACKEEGVDPGYFSHFFQRAQDLVDEGFGEKGIAPMSDKMLSSKKP